MDSSAGLEREIATAVGACVREPHAAKVIAWIGLDADVAPTLKEVAAASGCSRERVRQCVTACQRRFAALELGTKLEVLPAVLRGLERAGASTDTDVQSAMAATGIASHPLAIRGILRAAELFGIAHRVAILRDASSTIVGDADAIATLQRRRALASELPRAGCTTVERLAASWPGGPIAAEELLAALDDEPRVRWLDRARGWIWIPGHPVDALVRRIDKVLAVAGEIDVVELHRALIRDPRVRDDTPPVEALRSLLGHVDDVEWTRAGRCIRDTRPRIAASELSGNERVLFAVLREHGRPLPTPALTRLLVRAGMKGGSAAAMLATSVIIQPVDGYRHALVGTTRAAARRRAGRATDAKAMAEMPVGELARLAGTTVEAIVLRAMGGRARLDRRSARHGTRTPS